MVSRRRRRQGIGKIMVSVESRVRRIEKNPSPKRLKANVVTTEKLGFRAVTTKTVAADAITANEAGFGVTVVSATDPDIVKEGTTVVDPATGAQKVYSESLVDYVDVTDPTAQAAALASLQPSANTIVNASNQITAVNTNGITVYSGSSSTTGARIVMNSTGLAGFNSSSTGAGNGATFSISASTGDAIFSGTVNATGGTFTGYVTGGTARFGVNVDNTDDGIWINSNNYWYDTGSFKVGDATESMTYTSAGGLVVTGDINATGGNFTGYVTAGNMRIGSNVDLTYEGIYINLYNHWYDTGDFKVGDATESMTYTAAGGLVVTGEISAGTFSGNISSTATIAGGTITSTGTIGSYGSNTLTISGGKLSANSVIYLESTGWIDLTAVSGLSINADTEITGSIELSGDTLFNGFTNQINVDTDVGGTSTKNIRNVWIRSTLVATNASIPNSQIGDIWLQYA